MSAFGLGTAISIGSNLLDGILSRNESRRANARTEAFAREQFEWNKNFIQNRTADAKAAGIHPLYALGAAGAGSPSFTAGSADGLGRGIAAAGSVAGAALSKGAKVNPLQQELLRSQIHAQKAAAANDLATASYHDAQTALVRQKTVSTGTDMMTLQGLSSGLDVPTRTPRSGGPASTSRRGSTGTSNYIRTPWVTWKKNPNYDDAEVVEQRLGDIAQEFAGAGLLTHEVIPQIIKNVVLDLADSASGRNVKIRGTAPRTPRPRRKPRPTRVKWGPRP